MFKHYLLSTLRILRRNKLNLILNLLGLTLGLASSTRQAALGGSGSFLEDDNNVLRNRQVSVLRTGGDRIYVDSGLGEGDRMISLIISEAGGKVLTVSENGYGKRTEVTEFPTKGRGTQGVIAMQCSERNGELVGAVQVFSGAIECARERDPANPKATGTIDFRKSAKSTT